jgi:hypothetical protein
MLVGYVIRDKLRAIWSNVTCGLMLVEGVILLVHGLRLSLRLFPFYGDTWACFIGGVAILYLSRYAKPNQDKTDG